MIFGEKFRVSNFLISVFFIFFLLHVAKPILLPFIVAVFIWYLIDTISAGINKLINKKNNKILKILSLILGAFVFFTIITILVMGIRSNISNVVKTAPEYQQNLIKIIHKVISYFGLQEQIDTNNISQYINFPKLISYLVGGLTSFVTNLGMVALYVFFLFLEQSSFTAKIDSIAKNHKNKKKVSEVIEGIDKKIKKYLSVKTFISLTTAVLSYPIMRAVDLDFAMFWAILIFILNYIPTFGSIISTLFPVTIALVQFEVLYPFLIVAIGITAIQTLMGNIIEPRLLGKSLNLSPLIIVLSLVLWGSVWGIIGMFLGVPIMVVILLILSEIKSTRPFAILLSQKGEI